MSGFLTPAEVAADLRTTRGFVMDELRRKNLRGIKLGAGWRIAADDLQRYKDAHANVRAVRRPAS